MRASLGMYDHGAWRSSVDAWWQGIRNHLEQAGIDNPPDQLCRTVPLDDIWPSPDLLLAQTCGLPLRLDLAGLVDVVGRFDHGLEACEPGQYRAAIVSRVPIEMIGDELSVVINDPHSHSGRSAIAAFLAAHELETRVRNVLVSGGHAQSIGLLRSGEADLMSIDAVTLALLDHHLPGHRDGLVLVGWSEPAASLPLITATRDDDRTCDQVRRALRAACEDPKLAEARECLKIRGWVEAACDDYDTHEIIFQRHRQVLDRFLDPCT